MGRSSLWLWGVVPLLASLGLLNIISQSAYGLEDTGSFLQSSEIITNGSFSSGMLGWQTEIEFKCKITDWSGWNTIKEFEYCIESLLNNEVGENEYKKVFDYKYDEFPLGYVTSQNGNEVFVAQTPWNRTPSIMYLKQTVSIPHGESAKLSFDVKAGSYPDMELKVFAYSKDRGLVLLKRLIIDDYSWSHVEQDLSSYLGKEVTLMFKAKQLREPACIKPGWFFGIGCDETDYTERASVMIDNVSVLLYKRFVKINIDSEPASIVQSALVNATCTTCEAGTITTINVNKEIDFGDGSRYMLDGIFEGSRLVTTDGQFTVKAEKPMNLVAKYHKEYFLTVQSDYGQTQGTGWWNADAIATFSVSSPVAVSDGIRYAVKSYFGDAGGAFHKGTVKMGGPKQIKFQWLTQFYVDVQSVPDFLAQRLNITSGWIDEGTEINLYAKPAIPLLGKKYVFQGWREESQVIDNKVIVVNSPLKLKAEYFEQKEIPTIDNGLIKIITNSTIKDVTPLANKLSITVEGKDNTNGVLYLELPSQFMQAYGINPEETAFLIDSELSKHQTQQESNTAKFAIEYTHSIHVLDFYYKTYPLTIAVESSFGYAIPNAIVNVISNGKTIYSTATGSDGTITMLLPAIPLEVEASNFLGEIDRKNVLLDSPQKVAFDKFLHTEGVTATGFGISGSTLFALYAVPRVVHKLRTTARRSADVDKMVGPSKMNLDLGTYSTNELSTQFGQLERSLKKIKTYLHENVLKKSKIIQEVRHAKDAITAFRVLIPDVDSDKNMQDFYKLLTSIEKPHWLFFWIKTVDYNKIESISEWSIPILVKINYELEKLQNETEAKPERTTIDKEKKDEDADQNTIKIKNSKSYHIMALLALMGIKGEPDKTEIKDNMEQMMHSSNKKMCFNAIDDLEKYGLVQITRTNREHYVKKTELCEKVLEYLSQHLNEIRTIEDLYNEFKELRENWLKNNDTTYVRANEWQEKGKYEH